MGQVTRRPIQYEDCGGGDQTGIDHDVDVMRAAGDTAAPGAGAGAYQAAGRVTPQGVAKRGRYDSVSALPLELENGGAAAAAASVADPGRRWGQRWVGWRLIRG